MLFKPLKNLKSARILLCNDDGIQAHGIKLLEEILSPLCDDIWVIAPDMERSGASHSISSDTLRSMAGHSLSESFPNVIHKIAERHFAVNGTPSDCIRSGLSLIMPHHYPDLIISGINNGRNIADDITYSGTIGAAVEGVLHGIRSIAVSQLTDGAQQISWHHITDYLPNILTNLCSHVCNADCLININFPNVLGQDISGLAICNQGTRRFTAGTVEAAKMAYYNISSEPQNISRFADDATSIKQNKITISALSINLTNEDENLRLQQIFTG